MFIDTHAHIYLEQFNDDLSKVVNSAKNFGISKIFMPNIDSSHTENMLSVERIYSDICVAMMGLHPCSVKSNYLDELSHIESELERRKYAAVGEIGIDLFWDKTFAKEQEMAFRNQIELSRTHKIPFVIHSRDALDMTIDIVTEMQDGGLSGIFHCFNGSLIQAQKIIDIGFYMGIGGVVTFKNAGVDTVVKEIDMEHLVLETDAPYLAPAPFRGKRNSPEYIIEIAQKLSDLKNLPIAEIAKCTSDNAIKLYGSYAKG